MASLRQRNCSYCQKLTVKTSLCSSCFSASYCDSTCQRSAWPSHKASCKLLKWVKKKADDGSAASEEEGGEECDGNPMNYNAGACPVCECQAPPNCTLLSCIDHLSTCFGKDGVGLGEPKRMDQLSIRLAAILVGHGASYGVSMIALNKLELESDHEADYLFDEFTRHHEDPDDLRPLIGQSFCDFRAVLIPALEYANEEIGGDDEFRKCYFLRAIALIKRLQEHRKRLNVTRQRY